MSKEVARPAKNIGIGFFLLNNLFSNEMPALIFFNKIDKSELNRYIIVYVIILLKELHN